MLWRLRAAKLPGIGLLAAGGIGAIAAGATIYCGVKLYQHTKVRAPAHLGIMFRFALQVFMSENHVKFAVHTYALSQCWPVAVLACLLLCSNLQHQLMLGSVSVTDDFLSLLLRLSTLLCQYMSCSFFVLPTEYRLHARRSLALRPPQTNVPQLNCPTPRASRRHPIRRLPRKTLPPTVPCPVTTPQQRLKRSRRRRPWAYLCRKTTNMRQNSTTPILCFLEPHPPLVCSRAAQSLLSSPLPQRCHAAGRALALFQLPNWLPFPTAQPK